MTQQDSSEFISKGSCPSCGSSDANASYTDGHTYCFSCGKHGRADGETQTRRVKMSADLLDGDFQALLRRGITEETCRKFGYKVGKNRRGETVQIADYRDGDGNVVAQHIRDSSKDFAWEGDAKQAGLWGKNLWKDGGLRVIITEGEIDAMSVSQVFGNRWPVVSLPNGAQGGKKAIQKDLAWLETYDQVVLMFDMDEPGRAAAAECAAVLTPGRCKVAELPLKDANELLVKGMVKELTSAVYEARTFRPGGIVNGTELWDAMRARVKPGEPFPWECLNGPTRGIHAGRIITLTSGSGMGKSTVATLIGYDWLMKGRTVGHVALEENPGITAANYVSAHYGKRISMVDDPIPEEELRPSFDATLGTGRLWLYDHFGSLGDDELLSKIRYLVKGCGSELLILDHLSIVVSGLEGGDDERTTIDRTMTKLRSLVEETGIVMIVVCHLKRPQGVGHEDGGKISLSHLRGSAGVAQLSDVVLGIERNQQDDDPAQRNTIGFRILKNRPTGVTGPAGRLRFDAEKGTLEEAVEEETHGGFGDESGGRDF